MSYELTVEKETWTNLDMNERTWTNLDTASLSVSEAAEMLGVSDKTLRRWDSSGLLVPLRTPTGRRIYTREIIEAFQRNGKPSEAVTVNPVRRSSVDQIIDDIDRLSADGPTISDSDRIRILEAFGKFKTALNPSSSDTVAEITSNDQDAWLSTKIEAALEPFWDQINSLDPNVSDIHGADMIVISTIATKLRDAVINVQERSQPKEEEPNVVLHSADVLKRGWATSGDNRFSRDLIWHMRHFGQVYDCKHPVETLIERSIGKSDYKKLGSYTPDRAAFVEAIN